MTSAPGKFGSGDYVDQSVPELTDESRHRSPVKRAVFDTTGLLRDLRASIIDASVALVLTLALFGWLYSRVAGGSSDTIEVMPFMAGGAAEFWMYWLCEAFGWSALAWAWITVMLGLLRASRVRLPLSPRTIERLHRTTSLTTIGLMFAHAFWFFAEEVRANEEGRGVVGRTAAAFAKVFVPGVYPSGTGKIAILIGLLAFYLALPLGLAYYARRRMGPKTWRVLHASILIVYVLSVWHTLLYTTNAWYDGPFRTTIWVLQLPVAALLLVRLLTPVHRVGTATLDGAGRLVGRIAAAMTIVALLVVTATGRDGGRTRGVSGAGLNVDQWMVWTGLIVFGVVVSGMVVRAHRKENR